MSCIPALLGKTIMICAFSFPVYIYVSEAFGFGFINIFFFSQKSKYLLSAEKYGHVVSGYVLYKRR